MYSTIENTKVDVTYWARNEAFKHDEDENNFSIWLQ